MAKSKPLSEPSSSELIKGSNIGWKLLIAILFFTAILGLITIFFPKESILIRVFYWIITKPNYWILICLTILILIIVIGIQKKETLKGKLRSFSGIPRWILYSVSIIILMVLLWIFIPTEWYKKKEVVIIPEPVENRPVGMIVKPGKNVIALSPTDSIGTYFFFSENVIGYEWVPIDSIGTIYVINWEDNDTVYKKTDGYGPQRQEFIPGWYQLASDRPLRMKLKKF